MQLRVSSLSCDTAPKYLPEHIGQASIAQTLLQIFGGVVTKARCLETKGREHRVQAPSGAPELGLQRFGNASGPLSALNPLPSPCLAVPSVSQTRRDESN